MKPKSNRSLFDDVAARKIPVDLDLTRPILARARQSRTTGLLRRIHPAAIILIALLALLTLTGVAYAVFRLANDPGLQSVQDAGLVKSIDTTALPTLLAIPTQGTTPSAYPVAISQKVKGAVLTLKWVYLDQARLALAFELANLPDTLTLGTPVVAVSGAAAQAPLSWSFYVGETTAGYVAYHPLPADETAGNVDLSVDVPLIAAASSGGTPQAAYHFNVKDVPVYSGQSFQFQQTYAVKADSTEIRLKSVRVLPSYTEVETCYDFPTADAPFWYLAAATVQIGSGPAVSIRNYTYQKEITSDHCVDLGFQTGSAGMSAPNQLIFRVLKLVIPISPQEALPAERITAANSILAKDGIEIEPAPVDQTDGPGGWKFVRKPAAGTDPTRDPLILVANALEEKRTGPWEFYVDLPAAGPGPTVLTQPTRPQPTLASPAAATAAPAASPTPAPLGTQSLNGTTVTLDWAFADVRRIAVGYTINGLPDVPDATGIAGYFMLKDDKGDVLVQHSQGTVQRVDGKPGSFTGTWSMVYLEPITQAQAAYSLDITLGTEKADDDDTKLGYFPTPDSAQMNLSDKLPLNLPDHYVGVFHFDFNIPIYPQTTLLPGQTVRANGLDMTLYKVEMTPSYTSVTLCYQKPSAKDWGFAVVDAMPKLDFGDNTANIVSYRLLSDSDYGGYTGKGVKPTDLPELKNGRCVQIDFLLGHSNHPGTATLTIPAMAVSLPEVFQNSELKAALAKLKAEGIDMDYVTASSASGGGGAGPVYHALPAGMTEAEAFQHFLAALGYVQPGPWVFTFAMTP